MENREYTKQFMDTSVKINKHERSTWTSLMRQCMITSGVSCVNFMQGLFLGAPTVLVAQIQADVNSTEIVTDEMLSWLTTTPMLSSVPFVVILPLLFNQIGRKFTFLLVSVITLMGFIIFYNSNNLYCILISEICAGATTACTITISPIIISEYTSPKYRGIFSTLKEATMFWGIWISNAIGSFLYWKNIALVSFVTSVYLISVITWPESPYWLAKRGRYAESAKSHRWLKGVDESSEKELAQLIITQKHIRKTYLANDNKKICIFSGFSRIWSILKSRSFYNPAIICFILHLQYCFTGKFVISLYAIEILKHLTPDQSLVYKAMLILDGVTVFSMYVGCILSRYVKRRTMLIIFSGIGISILYILAVYLYLGSLLIIIKNDVVILLLLTVFSIVISCGPMILSNSIFGEIIPPRYQNTAMISVVPIGVFTMSILLKLSPFMFETFKMHGSFLFFAISSTVIISTLYIYLPETKDKTIQDIETYFTKNHVLVDQTTELREVELHNLTP